MASPKPSLLRVMRKKSDKKLSKHNFNPNENGAFQRQDNKEEITMTKIKKLVAAAVAAATVGAISVTSFADEIVVDESNMSSIRPVQNDQDIILADEGYQLISEEYYDLDDGVQCVTRLYQNTEDPAELGVYSEGDKTIKLKATNTYTYSETIWATMWVEAEFVLNEEKGTAVVKKESMRGNQVINDGPYFELIGEPEMTPKDNCGSNVIFFHKYAYVERKIKMTNGFANTSKTLSLKLQANCVGDYKATPKSAKIEYEPLTM